MKLNKREVENWQCQTCYLCMDKPFVEEHTRLTGHSIIIKKDAMKVANEIIKSLDGIPNLTLHSKCFGGKK